MHLYSLVHASTQMPACKAGHGWLSLKIPSCLATMADGARYKLTISMFWNLLNLLVRASSGTALMWLSFCPKYRRFVIFPGSFLRMMLAKREEAPMRILKECCLLVSPEVRASTPPSQVSSCCLVGERAC